MEPASTTVDPGSTATVRLRLRNTSDVVDEYRFMPVGELAPYITVEPPTVRLYPGTTGSVELTIAPPRTPDAAAGPNPYAVQIISTEYPDATTVPEGNVTVMPFSEVRAELVPHTVKGRFRGRPKLAIDNLGNTQLTASLTASDNGDQLVYEIHPANVQIEPGRAAFVRAKLKPRQVIWFGRKQNRPYSLAVRRSGQTPIAVDGMYVQRGVLPGWLAALSSIGLALLLAFIALWFGHQPSVSTQATAVDVATSASALPAPTSAAPAAPPAPVVPTPAAPVAAPTPAAPQTPAGSGGGGGAPVPRQTTAAAQQPAPAQPQPAPAQPQPQPQPQPNSGVEIIGQQTNRCVTVTDGAAYGGKDGKPLILGDCTKAVWQQWIFNLSNTPDRRGPINSLNLCMDVAGANTANGTVVQLANCSGDQAQLWVLTPQGDLVSVLANKCLDAAAEGGGGNGTKLQIWDCNGQPNQKWHTQ
ncbi:RICIN domain-containing protein [Kitasatospora viridis]|uniref:Ricin-type beta-trefoil lectin protein n=1 Tax=Kitasatospora viridis TaxID=281105 RepID=A0A561UFQ5_9ACTN|nr:ricin-type beta-trefoil lectin protein [Kitasatospora viridis]